MCSSGSIRILKLAGKKSFFFTLERRMCANESPASSLLTKMRCIWQICNQEMIQNERDLGFGRIQDIMFCCCGVLFVLKCTHCYLSFSTHQDYNSTLKCGVFTGWGAKHSLVKQQSIGLCKVCTHEGSGSQPARMTYCFTYIDLRRCRLWPLKFVEVIF